MTTSVIDDDLIARVDALWVELTAVPPITKPNYLIEELLVEGGLYFVCGGPKLGKSTLATHLSVAIVSGTPAFGRFQVPPEKQGLVMYLCVEGQAGVVHARAARVTREEALDGMVLKSIRLCNDRGFRLDDRFEMDRLDYAIQVLQPRLLVLDPLGRLHRSDERSGVAMTTVLERLFVIQQRYGFTTLVVHHQVKNGRASGATLRGSSTLWAAADGCLSLNPGATDGEVELTVEHREAPMSPTIVLDRIEPADAPSFFRLRRVEARPTTTARPIDVTEQVFRCIPEAGSPPNPRAVIRAACGMRNDAVGVAIQELLAAGRIERLGRQGYRRIVPVPGLFDGNGNPTVHVEGLDDA